LRLLEQPEHIHGRLEACPTKTMNPTAEFLADYQALTAGCGFAELPRSVIEVRGNDRTQFVHSFCTNDVKKLAPGRGCEAFITNHQGKTVGHVFIFCEPERLVIGTVAGQAAALIAHFDRFVISEDVTFRDLSEQVQIVLIAGSEAAGTLRSLAGAAPPTEVLGFTHPQIAGSPCTLFRVPYTGEHSFLIRSNSADAPKVRGALESAGARLCQADAVEAVRIESGFPYFSRDISDANLPQEVNRDKQAISFTKGCYLGQETVARIDALGHVNRLLVGLRFSATEVPPAGTPLQAAGKESGHITSSCWSPSLDAPLALAYVRRAQSKPGTRLESPAGACEVTALPVR
jgi:folate-binding protein YgfZ